MTEPSAPRKFTAPTVSAHKHADTPLVMVTAYDAPSARIVDAADVDMILVGDSVAMTVLGYDDTLQVTTDDIAHHVAAVTRTRPCAPPRPRHRRGSHHRDRCRPALRRPGPRLPRPRRAREPDHPQVRPALRQPDRGGHRGRHPLCRRRTRRPVPL